MLQSHATIGLAMINKSMFRADFGFLLIHHLYVLELTFLTRISSWIDVYLNNPTTRSTLGIDPSFGNYTSASREISEAFNLSGDLMHQNQLYIAELLHKGIRVLIYAGDYDFVCNWIGNNQWTLDLEWKGAAEFRKVELREWLVDESKSPAGLVRSSGNLTFATIHGAGHLVRIF